MKKKDKYLIENLDYFDDEIAKKMLKKMRLSDIIYYLTYFLLSIIYLSLIFVKISTSTLLFVSMFYFIMVIDLRIFQQIYINKTIKEAIKVTVCPEAFFNLNLYNAKKLICNARSYKYYLNNIAKSYLLLGKTSQALKIIKDLDKNKKNISIQGEIIQNKIDMAFMKKDLKEFNKQYEKLNNISKFISRKFRKEVKIENELKQAVLNNNIDEVNNLYELVNERKNKYEKIIGAFCKGIVLEENKKEDYEEYYKYVAENGNNLSIAKQIREKMKITETKYLYKNKKHLIYNSFKFVTFFIVLFVSCIWIPYLIQHL